MSLVQDLCKCRRKDFVEAAKEVISIFILSIIPIWLGALLMALIPRASVANYLHEFFVSGEALLISAALIGPSFYVITKKYGDLPNSLSIHFPQGWFLLIITFVICMFATAVFGLQRYSQLPPKQIDLFDPGLMQDLSISILIATFVTLFVMTTFRNYLEDGAAKEMHSGEEEFMKQWKQSSRSSRSRRGGSAK